MKKHKFLTIDFLRVLFAISIMIFHYLSWSGYDTKGFFNFISIYGVEGFFVISGIVLTYNYYNTLKIKSYLIHRFFRIAPLFYLAIILELLRHNQSPFFAYSDFQTLSKTILTDVFFLNILSPYKATVVSSWSIMVEVGLYIMFPIFIIIIKKNKFTFIILLFTAITIILHFIFFNILNPITDPYLINEYYTNVFYHLNFFLFGMILGYIRLINPQIIKISYMLFLLFVLTFFIDIKEYKDLLYGVNRLILSSITILFIGIFLFVDILKKLPNKYIKVIVFFSNLTYSIYLLHFFIFYIGYNIYHIQNLYILISIVILISIPTYYFYERFFIKLGKKYV